MRGCTQEDAPALEIFLTREPFDGAGTPSSHYVRIEIAPVPSGPVTLQLVQMRRKAGETITRAELVEAARAETWLTGTLTLTAPSASGHYDFATPAGRKLKGDFTAGWNPRPAMCG